MSPASGLVSILKKRNVSVDNMSVSPSSEPRPDKPTAKRRVRFKVPDEDYEQGMCVFIAFELEIHYTSLHIHGASESPHCKQANL